MKKIFLLTTIVVMCGGLFAQSKTEFKEQLTALESELAQLKKSDSLKTIQYQEKLRFLEEQISTLNTTVATQNISLKNYADQVERQNNEINSLSRLVAIDTALRNNPPASSSTEVSPREKVIIFTNANNRFKVPEGKTWIIHDYRSVNYAGKDHAVFVSIMGTQVKDYYRSTGLFEPSLSMVLEGGSEAIFEIRVCDNGTDYSDSRPAPSNAKFCVIVTEYDNE